MTDAEIRICHAMMNLLGQPKYRAKHVSDRRIIAQMLVKQDNDLLAFHSQWLFDLAWQKRHVLPADISVIVALKRGI